MIENDFGVAVPDPRNVHVSHLDATQPENQMLVAEGVLTPAEKWRQRYRFSFISLACSITGFISIFLAIVISLVMFNDSGEVLANLGLALFFIAILVSIVAMAKDRRIGVPCFAFAVAFLPLCSLVIFSIITFNAIASAVGN